MDTDKAYIDSERIRVAKKIQEMQKPELNCHVEILDNGLKFSYSGDAEKLFQRGANVAADQLWNKLHLIFMDKQWKRKYKVKDIHEFFDKYSPANIINGR